MMMVVVSSHLHFQLVLVDVLIGRELQSLPDGLVIFLSQPLKAVHNIDFLQQIVFFTVLGY